VSADGSGAWLKPWVLAAEVPGELAVEDVGADLEQEAGAAGCPAHLLLFGYALASDDLGRAARSSRCRGNDRYPTRPRSAAPARSQRRETMSAKLRRLTRSA
jgi:hypothetical protein